MLATLLETVACRLPNYKLWNVVDDISGHVAESTRMVQAVTGEAARLLVERVAKLHLPSSKGKSKVLIDGAATLKLGLLRQLQVLGIDEGETARNNGADLQLGKRRRALAVKGRLARAARRTKRARMLRKAGALETSPSVARILGSFGVRRSWASPKLSSKPSEWMRPKPLFALVEGRTRPPQCWPMHRLRGQRAWTLPSDITGKSCWHGPQACGKVFQTSTPCRRRYEEQLPGSVASRGRGTASPCCGWAGAPGQPGTSPPTMARRSTSWVWRRRRWASGSTRPHWCGQTVQRTGGTAKGRSSGRQSYPCWLLENWRDGPFGTEKCWSSWKP